MNLNLPISVDLFSAVSLMSMFYARAICNRCIYVFYGVCSVRANFCFVFEFLFDFFLFGFVFVSFFLLNKFFRCCYFDNCLLISRVCLKWVALFSLQNSSFSVTLWWYFSLCSFEIWLSCGVYFHMCKLKGGIWFANVSSEKCYF